MSDDTDIALPTAANEPESARAATPPANRPPARGGGLALLFSVAALAAGGSALWLAWSLKQTQDSAQDTLRSDMQSRLDALTAGADQRKRELESLRARLHDADGVNKSVREELLGLGERSRHLEDAIANLAEQRLSGRDAMAMNEAEFLLQLAQERLALFHDAHAAIAAYRLADSALAGADSPSFASIRQTIGAERQALEASKPLEVRAALGALERLRGELPTLARANAESADTPVPESRWRAFFSQFVRIHHSDDLAIAPRDIELARSLVALDLRVAEAALMAGDAETWAPALKRARDGLADAFDPRAEATQAALAELDRLAAQPLAPALPELGTALKELRNLRATRALSQPPVPAQMPAPEAIEPEAGA